MEVGCSLRSVCIYDSTSRVLKGTTESVIFGIGTLCPILESIVNLNFIEEDLCCISHQPKWKNLIADQVDAEAAKMPAEVPLEAERVSWEGGPSGFRHGFYSKNI